MNHILLLTSENIFYRNVENNILSGSCKVLHQLPRSCSIDISFNYFSEEASVIATRWKCVQKFIIDNRLRLIFIDKRMHFYVTV